MKIDDATHIRYLLDAAREAFVFTQGKTRFDLDKDRSLVLALVKEVEIVAQAASQISKPTRDQLPGLPWRDLIGLRQREIYAHFDVNLDVLWRTVQDEFLLLIDELERFIPADSQRADN